MPTSTRSKAAFGPGNTATTPSTAKTQAAKMAATIDDLSGGRFGINLVTGSFLDECTQMGILPPDYSANRYRYAKEWLHVVETR